MGNSALGREFSTRRLSVEEREAMKKFGDEEMQLLRETFKGLANARNGSAVDKETFLKCFPMPGLLGGTSLVLLLLLFAFLIFNLLMCVCDASQLNICCMVWYLNCCRAPV